MADKKAKNIMIQGTMSGVGKSVIAAALCRIFAREGYRTAPFKSQNMALNSYVTRDGGEMGRAQAMQAEAAGIEPDCRMNPILLKPSSDTGSQVILNGKVYGNMSAKEYFAAKRDFIPDIIKAYDSLAQENDIIVIEGAGSPAEINLKADDIVNMGLAKLVDAPVLLVGNIDPGGVFAQLYGTVGLLPPEEQKRIDGFIINRFRGDKSLLEPGIRMIEEKTRIRVIGTIPYMDIDLDDEDSLTDRFRNSLHNKKIDVAVIRLPHISNFTDLAPLESDPNIGIRYISRIDELCKQDNILPDMIILPGTKNTTRDLQTLRESGLADGIIKAAGKGCIILGICGGYQMLGKSISDPYGVEGSIKEIKGLGLLPVETVFENEKTVRQVEAVFDPDGRKAETEGFEIHMGRSLLTGGRPFAVFRDRNGCTFEDGAVQDNTYGTYLHGLFDSGELTQDFAERIAERKNVSLTKDPSAKDRRRYRQEQYDLLADTVRESLDMKRIFLIAGLR